MVSVLQYENLREKLLQNFVFLSINNEYCQMKYIVYYWSPELVILWLQIKNFSSAYTIDCSAHHPRVTLQSLVFFSDAIVRLFFFLLYISICTLVLKLSSECITFCILTIKCYKCYNSLAVRSIWNHLLYNVKYFYNYLLINFQYYFFMVFH